MIDATQISQRMVELGEQWADKLAAADALEDAADALKAQCFLEASGNIEERKAKALNDEDFQAMQEKARIARRDATKARVRFDSMKAWVELMRSQEATRRAEMQLT